MPRRAISQAPQLLVTDCTRGQCLLHQRPNNAPFCSDVASQVVVVVCVLHKPVCTCQYHIATQGTAALSIHAPRIGGDHFRARCSDGRAGCRAHACCRSQTRLPLATPTPRTHSHTDTHTSTSTTNRKCLRCSRSICCRFRPCRRVCLSVSCQPFERRTGSEQYSVSTSGQCV